MSKQTKFEEIADEVDRKLAAFPALVAALEAVEWAGWQCGTYGLTDPNGDVSVCPSCEAVSGVELHADDCQLAAALKLARGE